MTNLQLRIIAGLIGGAGVVAAICLSEWSCFALFLAITIAGQLEFYGLLQENDEEPNVWWGMFVGIALHSFLFFASKAWISWKYALIFFPLFTSIYIVELFRKRENPFENIAYTLQGIFYVVVPFGLWYLIAFQQSSYSYQAVLGALFLLWASDSGAYFAGKALGKHKLFERISPKKTWEGSIGGLILSLLVAFILSERFTDLSLLQWTISAVFIVVIGTLGDLVESMLKRSLQIKDSGSLIPGHGGILDRFDGFFIASPFVVCFLALF